MRFFVLLPLLFLASLVSLDELLADCNIESDNGVDDDPVTFAEAHFNLALSLADKLSLVFIPPVPLPPPPNVCPWLEYLFLSVEVDGVTSVGILSLEFGLIMDPLDELSRLLPFDGEILLPEKRFKFNALCNHISGLRK